MNSSLQGKIRVMPSYTLVIEALGTYGTDNPFLEIWADGVMDSSHAISTSGTTISITINYAGAMPSSLEFRFNDGSSEAGRSIEIRSVSINDRHINITNYLSSNSLNDGGSATVDTTTSFIFQGDVEPDSSEFTTGATQTFTAIFDTLRDYDGTTDQVFDLLDGNDYAHTGDGDDSISGGDGNDVIRGGGGDDLIFGAADNDRLFGQDGNDFLHGGTGDDNLQGNDGNDILYGAEGDDRLNGHDGNDFISGGEGDDKLTGGSGNDILYGGDGDDQLTAGSGDDTVDGGIGDDLVYGGLGADYIYGGDGNDVVIGNQGDDIIHGGDGDDDIYSAQDDDEVHGGNGNDEIFGGDGNDTITGGRDDDVLYGGDGNDVISATTITSLGVTVADILTAHPQLTYNAATGNFYQYVDNGATNTTHAEAITQASTNTVNGVAAHLATVSSAAEQAFIGTLINGGDWAWIDGSDTVTEGTFVYESGPEAGTNINTGPLNWFGGGGPNNSAGADNILIWDGGGDVLFVWTGTNNAWGYIAEWEGSDLVSTGIYDSSAETNTLVGGAGDDTLYGSQGDDILNGGADNDDIFGSDGVDTLTFETAASGVTANLNTGTATGDGNDTFTDIENLTGSDNNDNLTGDGGDNIINGGDGNDTIIGGNGNDTLIGGNGNDIIAAGTAASSGVTVADILAANPDVSYNAATGNFYQYVNNGNGSTTHAEAVTESAANLLNGVASHLATVTTAAEQTFIGGIVNTGWGWIDGSDSAVEGTFRHEAGPENGTVYNTGPLNWFGGGGPNNSGGADNIIFYDNSGADVLFVWTGTNNAWGYVAEWEGADVLAALANASTDTLSLSGGDGADVLYGGSAIDTFIFEAIHAYNDVDQIENFVTGTDGDILDLSDLLTGASGSITDLVNFVDSGGNTIIQVDSNGSAGGANFTTVGQINGITGLDEATLLADGNIIV